jgi:hypothetical protein
MPEDTLLLLLDKPFEASLCKLAMVTQSGSDTKRHQLWQLGSASFHTLHPQSIHSDNTTATMLDPLANLRHDT